MKKHRKFLKDLQTSEQFYNDQESRQIIGELIAMIDEGFNKQKADWIPCEVGDLIDKVFSHNEIVALWYEEPTEDVRYDKQIWRGMAWDIPKVYKECKFIKIFGTVPESIVEADTINIRIELPEPYKKEGDSDAT